MTYPRVSNRIIVFTRFPEPGTTKTRLIPALGPEGAAQLQLRMTQQVLKTCRVFAQQRGPAEIEIRHRGGSSQQLVETFGAGTYRPQASGSLGERLSQAIETAFTEAASAVIVIGSDCPDLRSDRLETASDALTQHDLVLGPARDGGYYLIGMRRPIPELFPGSMPWGTGEVQAITLALAARQGLSVHLLPTLTDIDRADDLVQLRTRALLKGLRPRISVIIPTLNEASHIGETMARARQSGVEIIVADGGSEDATAEVADQTGVRVVHSEPGRAKQMNHGARRALGEILLFLHADTLLPRSFVDDIEATLAQPHTTVGAFHLDIAQATRSMKRVAYWANQRSKWLQCPYGDQALFVKQSVFEQQGGFPEIAILEDYVLLQRLRKKGRIRMAPSAVTTSNRRWHQRGVLPTTLLNQCIILGYHLGISHDRLARLYCGAITRRKQRRAACSGGIERHYQVPRRRSQE